MTKKHIEIDKEIHKKLVQLKLDKDLKNMSDVINYLLSK